MRNRKFRRGFAIFCLSLLVLVLALPSLLGFALQQKLLRLGLQDPRVHFSFSALDSTSLGPLSVRFLSATNDVDISVEDLHTSYSLASLLEGRVKRIEVRNATIDLMDPSELAEAPASPPSLASVRALLGKLPADEVSFQNVLIRFGNASALHLTEGSFFPGREIHLKGDLQLAHAQLKGDAIFSLSTDDLKISGDLSMFSGFSTPFSLLGKVQGEVLEAQLRFPVKGFEQALVGSLRYAVDTENGEFQLRTAAKDSKSFESAFPRTLPESLAGLEAKEMRLQMQGKVAHRRLSEVSLSLKIHGLQYLSVAVEDINLLAEPRAENLSLLGVTLQARLLGGALRVARSQINLSNNEMEIPFQIDSLELGEILKLYPQEGLWAEGRLGGSLVLKRNAQGEIRAEGEAHAENPGGVIRYRRPENGESPSPLSFATEALEDFHYSRLQAPFTLDAAGELSIHLSLGGNNPSWQNGRAVEFNINLDQNLYSLLRSIRLSRGDLSAIR